MGDIVGRLFREFAVTLAVDDPGVGGGVADAHADDVRAPAAPRPEGEEGWFAGRSAAAFDWVIARYGADAQVGAAAADRDAAELRRDARGDGRALRDRAEGLLSGAGHRGDPRRLGGAPSRCRSPPWPSASRRSRRSCCGIPAVESLSSFIGIDGVNTTGNSRSHPDQPEAARRAGRVGERGDSGPGAEARRGGGGDALHAAGAGHHRRRSREPDAVAVQPGAPPIPRRCSASRPSSPSASGASPSSATSRTISRPAASS